MANTLKLFGKGVVGFIDWLGGILPSASSQILHNLPTIVQQRGKNTKSKPAPAHCVKKVILFTRDVEVAQLVDLSGSGGGSRRTDALKMSGNTEGREKPVKPIVARTMTMNLRQFTSNENKISESPSRARLIWNERL